MPRDAVRELVQLARTAGDGEYNLGPYLSEHAGELAPLLLTDARDLQSAASLPDEQVVVRLRPRLERALGRQKEEVARQREQEARAAAERLALSVRWDEGRAVLEDRILLGRELWSGKNKHVLFTADDFEVATMRDVVVRARAALATFIDVAAWVDREGLHLAWRGGHGRLNFYPQTLTPTERAAALIVLLPGPARVATARAARRPVLVGDVLAELGYF